MATNTRAMAPRSSISCLSRHPYRRHHLLVARARRGTELDDIIASTQSGECNVSHHPALTGSAVRTLGDRDRDRRRLPVLVQQAPCSNLVAGAECDFESHAIRAREL